MNTTAFSPIVLIHPPLTQQERYGIRFKAGGQTPPTGLALLAAVLREKGHEVALLDAAAAGFTVAQTVERALALRPALVGLTAVTLSIHRAAEVAQGLRSALPDLPVVLGGPHITAAPEETFRRFPVFDVAVLGEGESTLPELVAALQAGRSDFSDIPGLLFRKDGALIKTTPRPVLQELDMLPFPAWDLLPGLSRTYSPPAHTLRRWPAALVVPSRGCCGCCTFCDRSVFGRHLRSYSAPYILRMVRHLQDTYGIREIQFRDDNLVAFRTMLEELCHLLIAEKLDLTWSCAGRVDLVDADLLALMKRAGCWQIWYGIESGSNRVLKALGKGITVDQTRQAIHLTRQAGIEPCGFFMIGNPSETEADIQATLDLLLELPLSEFHMSHCTPMPGSALYRSASASGSFDDDWTRMNGWTTLFVPHGLTRAQLVHYSNLAFRRFYFRPRIIWSYVKKLRSRHHLKAFTFAFLGFLQYIRQKQR